MYGRIGFRQLSFSQQRVGVIIWEIIELSLSAKADQLKNKSQPDYGKSMFHAEWIAKDYQTLMPSFFLKSS